MLANRLLPKMLSCVLAVLAPATAHCSVLISNNTPYSVWVTSYTGTGSWGGMAQVGAECLAPRTAGGMASYVLVQQDDGNLCEYEGKNLARWPNW